MLRSLLRKAGLFLLVGIAPSVSDELGALRAAEGVMLGGKVPTPATTGAILAADEADKEGVEVVSDVLLLLLLLLLLLGGAEMEATAGAGADRAGDKATSVGLTTVAGVEGDIFDWKD